MALPGAGRAPACRWCGTPLGAEGFRCPACDGASLRSSIVGSRRTAEELGRAFPGVTVHTSGGQTVLAAVGADPALVVATPGAEPPFSGGYATALLLDAWMLLDRPQLGALVEALWRWATAAALVRSARAGGSVVLCGVPEGAVPPAFEALARWDPGWLAARELDERIALRLPPASVMAELIGAGGGSSRRWRHRWPVGCRRSRCSGRCRRPASRPASGSGFCCGVHDGRGRRWAGSWPPSGLPAAPARSRGSWWCGWTGPGRRPLRVRT